MHLDLVTRYKFMTKLHCTSTTFMYSWYIIRSSSRQLLVKKLHRTYNCDNYVPQWWVEFKDELHWFFTKRIRATRYMRVKRTGITEILRRICLYSASKIKSSESGSEQPTLLIVELNSSLWDIIVYYNWSKFRNCSFNIFWILRTRYWHYR